jgi:hypothetical protein
MLDDFDHFRITAYEPDQPIAKFQRISIHGGNPATVLPGAPGPNVNSQVTPKFTSFMRGVKRDKSHYKAFKLEWYWDDWNRRFRATAKTHDMMEVLDPTYVLTNTDDIALLEAKQTFMYSVFEEHLQTDIGKTLVRTHKLTSDAQKIYMELCSHMKNLASGTLAAANLLSEITNFWIHTARWTGSKRSFILNWKDKVREYNSVISKPQQLSSDFLKVLLQNMVPCVNSLNQLKMQEQFDITKGEKPVSFDAYMRLVTAACDLMDDSGYASSRSRPPRLANIHQIGQDHDAHTDYLISQHETT